MARSTTRVARGERGMDEHGDPQLGFDEALVGGADDQAANVTIDPSELAQNPFLGGEDEDDDWDGGKDKKPAGETPPPRERRETRHEREEPADDDEDIRLAYDEGEGEERGSGRRSRRNRSQRRAIDSRDETIAELQARLAKQEEVLSGLMGGQLNLSARDVDQRIQYHQNAIDRADVEIAKAIKEADGDTAVALQRERDKIVGGLFQLRQARQGMEERARQMSEGGQVDGQRQMPPEVRQQMVQQDAQYERMKDVFLERYTWFDPENGDDPDHDFVKRIDRKLVDEGYNRHQQAFWHEMERRMNKAGFRPDSGRPVDDDEEDDRPSRRNFQSRRESNGHAGGNGFARRPNLPPTGRVHSQTAPGRGERAFQMSDEQIDLLRQEGLLENNLDEKEQAKKDRIMGKWRRGAEALSRSRA